RTERQRSRIPPHVLAGTPAGRAKDFQRPRPGREDRGHPRSGRRADMNGRGQPAVGPAHLRRALRATEYFTIAFGSMIGVGWVIVMDDWLGRGGPGGAMLGFLAGGLALVPVAYVYGRLTERFTDAGSEVAYAEAVFWPVVSFAVGWLMLLAYIIVCPWEAVAIGRLAAYLAPGLDTFELYRVAGNPVFLPRLALGLLLTALITLVNYRGIRPSATFQMWMTFVLLALFVVFAAASAGRGSLGNLKPPFSHGPV